MIIDADAHVIETDVTWDYVPQDDLAGKPLIASAIDGAGREQGYWLVDGHARPKGGTGNVSDVFPRGARELVDVASRLRHMDELHVDLHVIYPSILAPFADRPDSEIAITHGQNRQLAQAYRESGGRLRWAAPLPLMSMDKAIEELKWVKENGACAVFVKSIEGARQLIDPYFFPLYQEAEKLDIPICVHASIGNQQLFDILSQGADQGNFLKFKLSVVGAFHQLVMNQIPSKFPSLRWGFIETSSAWIPFVVHDLMRRFARKGMATPPPGEWLRANNMYVACEADDDLPFILKYSSEDNIVIGTDYSHSDNSTEMEAITHLLERTDVDQRILQKIVDDNPRRLYSI